MKILFRHGLTGGLVQVDTDRQPAILIAAEHELERLAALPEGESLWAPPEMRAHDAYNELGRDKNGWKPSPRKT